MTSAQHLASHVAAHTRSLGAEIPAGARKAIASIRALAVRSIRSINAGDAFAAAGYTVMSLYAAGLVAYVAASY
ncbi:MAG TPA: hypothetical protein DCF73_04695 [Rhodobiaceae bacterium]|nr:hypothetical protein [Rhodobiaceae bacterium]